MKQLILVMMVTGVLVSCSRGPICPPSINGKIQHSKHLKKVRHKLRVKYHYHQTRMGRLLNFNLF